MKVRLNHKWLKDRIVIHDRDSWDATSAIAEITHPLLIAVKQNKYSCPSTSNNDVPENLYTKDEWDFCHEKWAWVLDEMIWTMEQIKNGELGAPDYPLDIDFMAPASSLSHDQQTNLDSWYKEVEIYNRRIRNGCNLFGKYFRCLWS